MRWYGLIWGMMLGLAVGLADAAGPSSAPAGLATSAPAASPAPNLAAEEIRDLVARLNHPDFALRQQAERRLGGASSDSLPELVAAYHRSGSLEVKLRLRNIIEQVFYRQQMAGQLGFIGIQPRSALGLIDPRTGQEIEGVIIQQVLAGFEAEKAGLLSGDVIVSLDAIPIARVLNEEPIAPPDNGAALAGLRTEPRMAAFTNNIKQRRPGSMVTMGVLRCDPEFRTVRVSLQDPISRTFEGAVMVGINFGQLRAVNAPGVPSVGWLVTQVQPETPAASAKLAVGDVIVTINGQQLVSEPELTDLATLLAQTNPQAAVVLTVTQLKSKQIKVRLGGRPVDMMNMEDMVTAQMRFAQWWREQGGQVTPLGSQRASMLSIHNAPARIRSEPTIVP